MADSPLSESNPVDGNKVTDQDRLVDEHLAAVYRYAFRLTGKTADAEDLTQQTFLTARLRIDQLRDPARARSWLLTVLRRCFLKTYRRKKETLATDMELEMEHIPDEPVGETFDGEALQTALDKLPPEIRSIVVMFYFENRSYKEIATAQELPLGTVMSRLSRAKTILRRRLFAKSVGVSVDNNKSQKSEQESSLDGPNEDFGFDSFRSEPSTDAKTDGVR
jgi:RNA polymerase sigma-70 factor (ECF subfamily)